MDKQRQAAYSQKLAAQAAMLPTSTREGGIGTCSISKERASKYIDGSIGGRMNGWNSKANKSASAISQG